MRANDDDIDVVGTSGLENRVDRVSDLADGGRRIERGLLGDIGGDAVRLTYRNIAPCLVGRLRSVGDRLPLYRAMPIAPVYGGMIG